MVNGMSCHCCGGWRAERTTHNVIPTYFFSGELPSVEEEEKEESNNSAK